MVFALRALFFSLILLPYCLYAIDLSLEEKAYLKRLGTVKVCVDPDWEPFEMLDKQGHYTGIGADLLKLVMQRLNINYTVLKTKDWDESVVLSQIGECQVISFLNQTPSRDKWLIFTSSHFSDPNVFITREEHPFIADPRELVNESIVFPTGTAMQERIAQAYPNLKIILSQSEKDAFQFVADKKAHIAMRSLIVAAYTIKKEGLFMLKISGQLPDYMNKLRIGVIQTEPMLRDILDKGVQSISAEDRATIVNKYVAIKAQTVQDYSLVLKVILGFALGGLVILWRFRTLRKHNQELLYLSETDLLTRIYNRSKIEKELLSHVKEAQKKNQPFSVLLLDIDHFKTINDSFGHPIGDKVLIEMTQVLQASIRQRDILGRWGGEEFLILCPNRTKDESMVIAKRILHAIQQTLFSTNLHHTISIGIATLMVEDTPYTLITKADNALYQAKKEGRNTIR